MLQKPQKLRPGDKVAAVSLSWGGAGDPDLLWRYRQGKQQLEEALGLVVVEMPHTLAGSEFIYEHPQARAKDLMDAFRDRAIKGVFSCIGGDDSIRLLPYIDFEVIAQNPKVFLGYSDSTITHLMCLKASLCSFYGPSILAEFGENGGIYPYTLQWLRKILFSAEVPGIVPAAAQWTGERIEWKQENWQLRKKMLSNTGYEVLQGSGAVSGRLVGGCMDVFEFVKGTPLWPGDCVWEGALLFLETSEETPSPTRFLYWLRGWAAMGVLQKTAGLLLGKPYQGIYEKEYKEIILKVLAEYGMADYPVLCNLSFGHNEPMCTIPIGALAEVDFDQATFKLLESGVSE